VWDQDKVDRAVEEVGVQAISVLPESIYYPKTAETGSRWIKSEGLGDIFQLWVAGDLVVEKWFPTKPDIAGLDLFLRSLVLPTNAAIGWSKLQEIISATENVGQMNRLPAPWGAKSKTWSLLQKLPWEHSSLLVAGAVILIAYTWTLSSTVVAANSLQSLKNRTKLLVEGVEEVLKAKNSADTLSLQAKARLTLIDYPSQLAMMADIAKVLIQYNVILSDWHFKGASLEVISDGQVNALNMVKDFEQLDWVSSVSVSSQRNQSQNKFVLKIGDKG
jgi:hypothetical protein